MAERSLVTGVAGFIGSHLAEALLARGHEVVGIDCLTDYYDPALKEANLRPLLAHSGFRFHRIDLAEADLDPALAGVDLVFHQAAQAGVRASWGREFAIYTRQNLEATQHLLELCRGRAIKKFVYASSSSVYGETDELPMREEGPTRPHSPYGVTKLAGEHLAALYHRNFGVPALSLRYFTVYGPRQRPDMAFNRFIRGLLEHRPLVVYGDGSQTRDFTFVGDIVAANLAAAERGVPGRVYNIGGGSRVALSDCLDLLVRLVGQGEVRYQSRQHGDVTHTYADTSRARAELGFAPEVVLAAGLERQVTWQRALAAREPPADGAGQLGLC
jgi:nucleoside-diphosphate-sugar epimerase